MTIEKQIIGVKFSGLGNQTFYSYNSSADNNNHYLFYKSTSEEISVAAEKATIVFKYYELKSDVERVAFLETINLADQLRATVHGTGGDLIEYKDLLLILKEKTGRIIINGFPAGVEVSNSMVHGGPFSRDYRKQNKFCGNGGNISFRKTSMLSKDASRFITKELMDTNPMKIYRLMNGKRTKETITKSND